MISPLDSNTRQFLANLDRINAQMSKAQAEISSGLRINAPSDSPDQISSLLAARSQLAATTQIQTNYNLVKGESDAGESALSQAVSILDQVTTLGTQGSSDVLPAAQKQTLADQITGLEQQLVGLASTAFNGRYIFGGNADQTPPYVYSATGTPPYGTFQGSASTRQIQTPSGSHINIALNAQQIFEDPNPSNNVFAAVEGLRQALLSGNTAATSTALSTVRTSAAFLNKQLAFYGQVQNEVTNGLDAASAQVLQLKTQISGIEDADLPSAIVEMNQAQIQQQATLQAGAKTQTMKTLFDYLP